MGGDAVAWQDPETRRSHAAYRLGALRWCVGGIAGFGAAAGLSVYAVVVLKRPGLGVFIVTAVILGAIALTTGAGGLLRARRFRTALAGAPWQPVRLRMAGAHLRLIFFADQSAAQHAEDDDDVGGSRTVDARLMTTSRWRVREVVGFRDAEVCVCPLDGGDFVLTARGLVNLYGLKPLAQRWGRDRT